MGNAYYRFSSAPATIFVRATSIGSGKILAACIKPKLKAGSGGGQRTLRNGATLPNLRRNVAISWSLAFMEWVINSLRSINPRADMIDC
jgi:hypothetical protein